MEDDIVIQLRQVDKFSDAVKIMDEAAGEIERLRHKIQDLRMHAEQDACEIERLQTKLIAAYDDIGRNHAIIDQLRKDNPT